MTVKQKIPSRLKDDAHLIETCFEIRFEPMGDDLNEIAAIPSRIISKLQNIGAMHLTMTSHNNLPPVVRDETPDLKFSATHHAEVDGYRYMFNERSIAISPIQRYPGWADFSPKVQGMLGMLDPEIIKSVIRVGYRSIDFFVGAMEGQCTLKVESPLNGLTSAQHFVLCKEDDFSIRVGVGENITMAQCGSDPGVVIDVDVSMDRELPAVAKDLKIHADRIHDCCKKVFFSLITEELIESKEPVYD